MKKKEFDTFKGCVKKWCENLGVKDWAVSVEMESLDSDRAAQCQYESQNRYAIITIDSDIDNPSPKNLDLTARHEVLELVLADIRDALNAYYNSDLVDKHVHRVIRKLENNLR